MTAGIRDQARPAHQPPEGSRELPLILPGAAHGNIVTFQAQEQQLPVLQCRKRGCLVLGGNRGGKTVTGAAEAAYRLLGDHPAKEVHRPPIKVWAASQDMPGTSDQPHKQLDELRRWIPKEALRGGSWQEAFSPMARVLTLANGSVVVFKSYNQDLLKFESDAIHFAWLDEEPDDKRIWSSILLRLADYDGAWMITATPVLSLQGRGWLEELWERRREPDCGFETHQLFSNRNPHLPAGVLDELFANLTEEERQVRAFGAFARLGGRVLDEFDPSLHLVAPFPLARDWRHYLVIDPGWTRTAPLFAAVDREGRLWLYDEQYEGQRRPAEHMQVLHLLWQLHGKPDYDVLMDPAAFALKRTTTRPGEPVGCGRVPRGGGGAGGRLVRTAPGGQR